MPSHPPRALCDHADRYHGFSLDSVGWGHRELVERLLNGLFECGLIGPHRSAVTATLCGLLRQADQGPYDPVLRRFLEAINPRTEWLLDAPALFAEIVDLGRDLAASQPHRGIAFFALLGDARLGQTVEQLRHTLSLARRLLGVDADLCLAFLEGSGRLAARLRPADLERFVGAGLDAFAHDPTNGLAFMRGALDGSRALLRALALECRLEDIEDSLGAFARALTGPDLAIADLASLPSDEVARRGCGCVLLSRTLYLPARVDRLATRQHNQGWYTLAAAVAAATLRLESFSRIHGQPGYLSLRGLVGADPLALNALLVAEWQRLLAACTRDWPGVRRLLQAGLEQDLSPGAGRSAMPAVVRRLLLGPATDAPAPLAGLVELAQACPSVLHTAALLTPPRLADLRQACPELAGDLLPPLSFMPDFLLPACIATPVAEPSAPGHQRPGTARPALPSRVASRWARPPPTTTPLAVTATHVYDEWSAELEGYLPGHCCLQETMATDMPTGTLPAGLAAEGERVRRAFERLKPSSARREKGLCTGDEINLDRLVDVVVQRGVEPSPRADIYEKPRFDRRDLAVLVLLDLSGSTGDLTPTGERVIDLECRAALALSQGLAALGDRFALCGFNSAGPRQCAFLVFKDFAERWEHRAVSRLLAAVPAQRTRIGPALRHAGKRLAEVPCRQRLILLITDGRPTDTGYDPATHYAHADVRQAGKENARQGVQTFAVSTTADRAADLELMFPGRRFVILPDVRHLPRALPALYSRLTL